MVNSGKSGILERLKSEQKEKQEAQSGCENTAGRKDEGGKREKHRRARDGAVEQREKDWSPPSHSEKCGWKGCRKSKQEHPLHPSWPILLGAVQWVLVVLFGKHFFTKVLGCLDAFHPRLAQTGWDFYVCVVCKCICLYLCAHACCAHVHACMYAYGGQRLTASSLIAPSRIPRCTQNYLVRSTALTDQRASEIPCVPFSNAGLVDGSPPHTHSIHVGARNLNSGSQACTHTRR